MYAGSCSSYRRAALQRVYGAVRGCDPTSRADPKRVSAGPEEATTSSQSYILNHLKASMLTSTGQRLFADPSCRLPGIVSRQA